MPAAPIARCTVTTVRRHKGHPAVKSTPSALERVISLATAGTVSSTIFFRRIASPIIVMCLSPTHR